MKNNKSKRQLDSLDVAMGFFAGFVIGTFLGIITAVIRFV